MLTTCTSVLPECTLLNIIRNPTIAGAAGGAPGPAPRSSTLWRCSSWCSWRSALGGLPAAKQMALLALLLCCPD